MYTPVSRATRPDAEGHLVSFSGSLLRGFFEGSCKGSFFFVRVCVFCFKGGALAHATVYTLLKSPRSSLCPEQVLAKRRILVKISVRFVLVDISVSEFLVKRARRKHPSTQGTAGARTAARPWPTRCGSSWRRSAAA